MGLVQVTGSVKVSVGSVTRAWREGGGEFWLQLRARDGSGIAFAEVIAAANDAEEEEREGEGIFAQLSTETPHGHVTMVDGVRDADDLARWLSELAARLEHAGFSGTLQGVTPAYYPGWASSHRNPDGSYDTGLSCEPTAFVAWSFDLAAMTANPYRESSWDVPPEATTRICDLLADWVLTGGPEIILRRSTFKFAVADGSTASGILAGAIESDAMAGAICYHDSEPRGRAIAMIAGGETLLQVVRGPESWHKRTSLLREAMTALPGLLDQAFVRPALRTAVGWNSLDNALALSGITEADVRYNKHLLDRWVPDAHGIQVLRDAHLTKASDLTDWNVTDLGHGRHLVEATDLAPWYQEPFPDPDTLTKARQDFGPMLLTKAVIAEHPPPWR